jgi:hypothetical protein
VIRRDPGKRMTDLGMKFGIHAHLNSSFETAQDVEAIMERTNPKRLYFICDTGHTTMAGMDPVKLTRDYTSRIIEYHLKDVLPEHKGGYKGPPMGRLAARTGRGRGMQQAQPRFRPQFNFEIAISSRWDAAVWTSRPFCRFSTTPVGKGGSRWNSTAPSRPPKEAAR